MKAIRLIIFTVCIAGCSMPATTVKSVDTRPSISISRVNEQAELFVDGIHMGKAANYEEPNQLKLEPGTHLITIREGGKVIFEQNIFVESEHKNIIAR